MADWRRWNAGFGAPAKIGPAALFKTLLRYVSVIVGKIVRGETWNSDFHSLFGEAYRAQEKERDAYSVALIQAAFAGFDGIQIWGDDFKPDQVASSTGRLAAIATETAYLSLAGTTLWPRAIVLGHEDPDWVQVADQWRKTPPELRALLVHSYLPGTARITFAEYGLPLPLPLLPILHDSRAYIHCPEDPAPTANQFAIALKVALERNARATFERPL